MVAYILLSTRVGSAGYELIEESMVDYQQF
jgi:hypothetical protein